MLYINEDPFITFSNICLSLGLTDHPLLVRITDPHTLQFIKITLWRMNGTCNCLDLLQQLLINWRGAFVEVEPVNAKVAHCCTELLLAAGRTRRKPKMNN